MPEPPFFNCFSPFLRFKKLIPACFLQFHIKSFLIVIFLFWCFRYAKLVSKDGPNINADLQEDLTRQRNGVDFIAPAGLGKSQSSELSVLHFSVFL